MTGDRERCAHCGQELAGAASVNGRDVCHPSDPDRPDCYRLVTVYGEALGSRRPSSGTDPAAPDGEGPVPDQCRRCESYILPDGIGWRHALGPTDHKPEPEPALDTEQPKETPTCCWFDGDRCMTHGTDRPKETP